jgi:hypothetical protein
MVSACVKLHVLACCVAIGCCLASSADAQHHMSEHDVAAIGKRAIEARFPGSTKGRSFGAFRITDGYWAVFSPHADQANPLRRGEPVAEVRDSDGKVVSVRLAP